MGSCKFQNMSHMSYCQREVSEHSYDQTKHLIMLCQSKPIVQCPVYGTLTNFCALKAWTMPFLCSAFWNTNSLSGGLRLVSLHTCCCAWRSSQGRFWCYRSLGTLTLPHGAKHRRLSMTLQPWSFYWGRDYTSTNGLSFDLPSGRYQHTLWTYYGTKESKRLLFYAWPLGGNMTLQT